MTRLVVSDRTLAELIAERLRSRRAFRLFAMRLGGSDVVYTSALAWSEDGRVLEVRASAEQFEDALVQLLANLDLATDERATETLLDREIDRPGPRPELERPRAPRARAARSDVPPQPHTLPEEVDARRRRFAMDLVARRGAVTVTSLMQALVMPTEDHKAFAEHREFLEQLVADGTLRKSRRFGFVAADAPEIEDLEGT